MRNRTRRRLALGSLTLALLAGGCGGSSRVESGGTDFVPFFASVFVTSAEGTTPVSLAGRTFVNQFPTDPTTFDFLLP